MNDFNFTTDVNSLDLAALLVTLGFDLKECKVVNHINLNSQNHSPRPISASWHFSTHSPYCPDAGHIEKVMKRYSFPSTGEPAVNVYQLAKIAAHNYQVLKSVILEGKKLQQIKGPNYTIFKNNNGENIPQDNYAQFASCDIASIAVAGALGCEIAGYSIINNKLFVRMNPTNDGINLRMIEDMKQDYAISNTTNFNTLPVLIATFINREQLMNEMHEQSKAVMITRGDKLVMFGKNTSDKLKHKALRFINE